jgi:predicted RNA-binding protein (virulence factor B family)
MELEEEKRELEEGQKVELKIVQETALGFSVMINDEFEGLLYRSEVFQDIEEGMEVEGYVKEVREDGKIDVSLRPQGFLNVIDEDSDKVLDKLQKDGFLLLTDKSSPDAIRFRLQMSKKAFKKAIGNLYRRKLITLGEDRIELIKM